jgi:hypothetical protein
VPEEEDFILLEDGEPEEPKVESEGSRNFKKTKWYRRRSSNDLEMEPEKPLYLNRYFQVAGSLFILLVVAVLNI